MKNIQTIRHILHIDMDAFYASVEQRDNPELRDKPIAVGREQARGVVAAASYEARAFGVHSALPSLTAKRRCPQLIFVPPRFEVYREISHQIRDIFTQYTDLVEPLSLDEAYLDVTHNKMNIKLASDVATQIRTRIKQATQLNASAGISYNKFLAKIASDLNKPNGQAIISPAKGPAFVARLAIKKFHGVGPATANKMERLGILTGADLKAKSLKFLQTHFGKSGLWYYQIARGIDERPVETHRVRKSIGKEDTFANDIFELDHAKAQLPPLANKIWQLCQNKGLSGKTVTVKIKYSDFQTITRSKTLSQPVRSQDDLFEVAWLLLQSTFPSAFFEKVDTGLSQKNASKQEPRAVKCVNTNENRSSPKGIRLIGITLSSLIAHIPKNNTSFLTAFDNRHQISSPHQQKQLSLPF